jgi:hypothetical protein
MRFDPDAQSYPYFDGSRDMFGRLILNAEVRRISEDRRRDVRADAFYGRNIDGGPAQYAFRVGGRETLPGYNYRSLVSDQDVALGRVEYSHTVAAPWLRLRALGYAASTREFGIALEDDIVLGEYDRRFRASAGVGAGLLWDVLRVDLVKGAHWQTIFSVRHDFWDLM